MSERDIAAEMREAADKGVWLAGVAYRPDVIRDWADQVEAQRIGFEAASLHEANEERAAERARIRRELEPVLAEMREVADSMRKLSDYTGPDELRHYADRIEEALGDGE